MISLTSSRQHIAHQCYKVHLQYTVTMRPVGIVRGRCKVLLRPLQPQSAGALKISMCCHAPNHANTQSAVYRYPLHTAFIPDLPTKTAVGTDTNYWLTRTAGTH